MKETSVILMKDWKPLINALPESDRCYFFDLLLDYEYGVEQACERPMVYPVWTFVRSQLDKMKEKYENICEKNRSNGLKGGRPKKQDEPKETEQNRTVILETEKTPNDNDNDKDNNKDNDKDNDKKSLVGNPPTGKVSKPKKEKEVAKYFIEAREMYLEFTKTNIGITPEFKNVDGISLSTLINILEKRAKEQNKEFTLDYFKMAFNHFMKSALNIQFIKDDFTIPMFVSKFNKILIQATKNN